MNKHEFTSFRSISIRLATLVKRKMPLLVVLAIPVVALATPPFGILLNQIVAMGTASDDIKQELHVGPPDGSGDREENAEDQEWRLHLSTHGASDFYSQYLVIAPIDFYDANCQKHSFAAGQVFTENTQVHAVKNPGIVNTTLSIAYLIKHSEPRRIEAAAPTCAPWTGIP